jgi:hypothetical protein
MMERLSRSEGLGAGDRDLGDLLRAAEPYQADPFRKRRVLVKVLGATQGARALRWPRIVTAGVLLTATAAAAASGGLTRGYEAIFGSPAEAPAPVSLPAADGVALPAEPAPRFAPPPVASAPASEGDAKAPPPSKERARPSAKASENPEDAAAVLDAIRALRKERDPARAERLLGEYMKTNPNGVLSEDALALSIEAAAAKRDPRAAEYARRYLARYPQGKYRAVAQRALEQAKK